MIDYSSVGCKNIDISIQLKIPFGPAEPEQDGGPPLQNNEGVNESDALMTAI